MRTRAVPTRANRPAARASTLAWSAEHVRTKTRSMVRTPFDARGQPVWSGETSEPHDGDQRASCPRTRSRRMLRGRIRRMAESDWQLNQLNEVDDLRARPR